MLGGVNTSHGTLALYKFSHISSCVLTTNQGTPAYIARAACLGMIMDTHDAWEGRSMPELQGDALQSYIKAHGEERYERYSDKDGTCHGGTPLKGNSDDMDENEYPPFCHRPEHDVESIYWSMVSALLRARTISAPIDKYATNGVAVIWDILNNHEIPENPEPVQERRNPIVEMKKTMWVRLFCPEMHDVAVMLSDISKHVRSEYALWSGDLHPDHLHEAI